MSSAPLALKIPPLSFSIVSRYLLLPLLNLGVVWIVLQSLVLVFSKEQTVSIKSNLKMSSSKILVYGGILDLQQSLDSF